MTFTHYLTAVRYCTLQRIPFNRIVRKSLHAYIIAKKGRTQ